MLFKNKTLLVCDLDRTILPDGQQPASVGAMDEFTKIVKNENAILVYATGRSLKSALSAIREFAAPHPNIFIGDVGTTMYFNSKGTFNMNDDWQKEFKKNWGDVKADQIFSALTDIDELTPQDRKDQNEYKVSYFSKLNINRDQLNRKILGKLSNLEIDATVLITENEEDGFCYVDILPKSATKIHALNYLVKKLNFPKDNVIYCGDSRNDLEPLVSGYKAIVVNNASDKFKIHVENVAKQNKILDSIYFAKGGYLSMNGNYSAGILEGLHYFGYLGTD